MYIVLIDGFEVAKSPLARFISGFLSRTACFQLLISSAMTCEDSEKNTVNKRDVFSSLIFEV